MTNTPTEQRPRGTHHDRRGITARARVLAAAGVVLATAVAGSFALFSDTGRVAATFSSGSVDLKFDGGADGDAQTYDVTFTSSQDMAPGDTAQYPLAVYNSGSVPATLTMSAPQVTNTDPAAAEPLEGALVLTVRDAAAAAGAPALYSGPLASAALAGIDLGSGGSPTSGAVTLVFEVALPTGASAGVAGQEIDVVFPFTATQAP